MQQITFHSPFKSSPSLDETHYINILGIVIKISANSGRIPQEILQLKCESTSAEWTIDCYLDQELEQQIGSSENPGCKTYQLNEYNYIYQRDFIAVQRENYFQLMITSASNDGVYNFFRWFLPRLLVDQDKLVLHSSCVVTNDWAQVFLGPSGAGKTTLSSFADQSQVLGDDLNVARIKDGQLFISSCPFGQQIQSQSLVNQWFPVKSIYWLSKSEHVETFSLKMATQFLYLISSTANLSWPDLDEQRSQKVRQLLMLFLQSVPCRLLAFPKNQQIMKQALRDL